MISTPPEAEFHVDSKSGGPTVVLFLVEPKFQGDLSNITQMMSTTNFVCNRCSHSNKLKI